MQVNTRNSRSLDKALFHSVVLAATRDTDSAIGFLESFAHEVSESPNSNCLGKKIDAFSLLTYFCTHNKSPNTQIYSQKVFDLSETLQDEDLSWLVADAKDDLSYYVEDKETLESMLDLLSSQEIKDGYISKIITFSFYFTVFSHAQDLDKRVLSSIKSVLKENMELLMEHLGK